MHTNDKRKTVLRIGLLLLVTGLVLWALAVFAVPAGACCTPPENACCGDPTSGCSSAPAVVLAVVVAAEVRRRFPLRQHLAKAVAAEEAIPLFPRRPLRHPRQACPAAASTG